MSTSKEQRREKQEETMTVTPSSTTTTTSTPTPSQVHQEQQQSVNRALDETKNNIKRATDEARRDIPRYTQAVNEYHEQTIQATREIADNYLESQKEIINSFQSAWLPQIETANRVFTSNWMVSPRHIADNYARIVSSFADSAIAATRLVNNTIFANLEAFKTSVQNARDNAKEFSRIGVNAARTLEQTSRDTARAAGHDTSSARIYVEREEQQQQRRF
jgi:vacuolar-type H+-ATPase subunit H